MIQEIEVAGLRVFRDPARLPLAAITVVCGTNGAGKSSVLKSLVLLKQSHTEGVDLVGDEAKLRFVGQEVDLGDFRTLVSDHDVSKSITLGITTSGQIERVFKNSLNRSLGGQVTKKDEEAEEQLVPFSAQCRLTFDHTRPSTSNRDRRSRGRELSVVQATNEGWLRRANFAFRVDNSRVLRWSVERSVAARIARSMGAMPPRRRAFSMTLPRAYFDEVGGTSMVELGASGQGRTLTFPVVMNGLFPALIWARPKLGQAAKSSSIRKKSSEESWQLYPAPPAILGATQAIQQALQEVHYLGPLRAAAQRYYLVHGTRESPLDSAGAFVPYLVYEKGAQQVWTSERGQAASRKKEPLSDSLNYWVHYLRTGDSSGEMKGEFSVDRRGDVVLEPVFLGHALADSGFGFSQVLPILVRCLLAKTNETIIIEQPELHLNPGLQLRLSEFFMAMANSGKQLVIETHSEHIVNALRVLSAEARGESSRCQVRIYFLQEALGGEAGKPDIRTMDVGPDGMVANWPRNFFGEASDLTGRLLRAQREGAPSK